MAFSKTDLQPYKGARDFYPEDMRVRQFWQATCQTVVESFGYEPYDGPMLERLELYQAKTSEEIVSGQTYVFDDRGGRRVVIRPEMTPTFARMVAARAGELPFPLRWYSFPNLWRYERPQKGRLREHWQLNCDLVAPTLHWSYEAEMIRMVVELMRVFGAKPGDYKILVNHRGLTERALEVQFGAKEKATRDKLFELLDKLKKNNMKVLLEIARQGQVDAKQAEEVLAWGAEALAVDHHFSKVSGDPLFAEFSTLLDHMQDLTSQGIVVFDPSIVRGFQYYTGLVFECVDQNPNNPRSLLGGGRYDNLIGQFSNKHLQGIGFGWGDVTFQAFLENRGLLEGKRFPPRPWVILVSDQAAPHVGTLQVYARNHTGRTLSLVVEDSALFKSGLKQALRYNPERLLIMGRQELESRTVLIKNTDTRDQTHLNLAELS
jgi:histidyl-tRNA synthetase